MKIRTTIINCPRFIKQTKKKNCIPVALINYWKWVGLNVGLKDLPFVEKILESDSLGGTLVWRLENIVGSTSKNCSWKYLLEHISTGGTAFIISDTHCWFIPSLVSNRKDDKPTGVLHINYKDKHCILTFKETEKILKSAEVILL